MYLFSAGSQLSYSFVQHVCDDRAQLLQEMIVRFDDADRIIAERLFSAVRPASPPPLSRRTQQEHWPIITRCTQVASRGEQRSATTAWHEIAAQGKPYPLLHVQWIHAAEIGSSPNVFRPLIFGEANLHTSQKHFWRKRWYRQTRTSLQAIDQDTVRFPNMLLVKNVDLTVCWTCLKP